MIAKEKNIYMVGIIIPDKKTVFLQQLGRGIRKGDDGHISIHKREIPKSLDGK